MSARNTWFAAQRLAHELCITLETVAEVMLGKVVTGECGRLHLSRQGCAGHSGTCCSLLLLQCVGPFALPADQSTMVERHHAGCHRLHTEHRLLRAGPQWCLIVVQHALVMCEQAANKSVSWCCDNNMWQPLCSSISMEWSNTHRLHLTFSPVRAAAGDQPRHQPPGALSAHMPFPSFLTPVASATRLACITACKCVPFQAA